MNDAFIDQVYEESISFTNQACAGMKQVQFVDEVEKAKKRLIMGDIKNSRMCNIDGEC